MALVQLRTTAGLGFSGTSLLPSGRPDGRRLQILVLGRQAFRHTQPHRADHGFGKSVVVTGRPEPAVPNCLVEVLVITGIHLQGPRTLLMDSKSMNTDSVVSQQSQQHGDLQTGAWVVAVAVISENERKIAGGRIARSTMNVKKVFIGGLGKESGQLVPA